MKRIAIIGGGIAGLSALHFIKTECGDECRVVLYEREDRLGGTIGTDRVGGFISDWGPNGFLDRVPLTLQMVSELGADDLLDPAKNSAGNRYIFNKGRLHPISTSPIAFMRSPLLFIVAHNCLDLPPSVPLVCHVPWCCKLPPSITTRPLILLCQITQSLNPLNKGKILPTP